MRAAVYPIFTVLMLSPLLIEESHADDSEQKIVIEYRRDASDDSAIEREVLKSKPDVGQSMAQLPGANFNQNGLVSTIPQYRGHIGTRTSVLIDGFTGISAGPNLMDAPLSYANSNWVQSITLYRGITPVSIAYETIGSAVEVNNVKTPFAANNSQHITGDLKLGFNSNGSAIDHAVNLGWANNSDRLQLLASQQEGDILSAPRGELANTFYDKRAQQFSYGKRFGNHQFDISLAKQDVDNAGTPALPMDIIFIDGEKQTFAYRFDNDAITVTSKIFNMDADHIMNNFELRPNSGNLRETYAVGTGDGATIDLQWMWSDITITAGFEQRDAEHSATIFDPSNNRFRVTNFNAAERSDTSLFIQSDFKIKNQHEFSFGVRAKSTETNSGEVSHHMAMMSPAIGMLQNQFNQSDRRLTFNTEDIAAIYSWSPNTALTWHAALGQKSRAPVYQELYLWVPMQSTGGLADGNVYIGNLDLDPEIVLQAELGLTVDRDNIRFSPQVYFHKLHDYIQGTVVTNSPANMVASMMGQPQVLQFNNVDGEIYGLDAELLWRLNDNWNLASVLTIVRGTRTDIDDNLYRITPDNIQWQLNYHDDLWALGFELQAFAAQDRTATLVNELPSSGYAVFNLNGRVDISQSASVEFGLTNIFDREYQYHTAGVNRVANNVVGIGERLPEQGRAAYLNFRYFF